MLADADGLGGWQDVLARDGIWAAAILFPLGFFLAASGRGTTAPSRFLILVYGGTVALTAGVLALGIGLLTS